jgi:tellurite resistance protein TerC
MATPLLAVLITVESADVVFAVDSIPAIFAITTNAFVVWTSNSFAILGLRALSFMLASLIKRFVYLSVGLSVILVFVGAKFSISDLVGKVPIYVSLPFIATVVAVSIVPPSTRPGGRSARRCPVREHARKGNTGAWPDALRWWCLVGSALECR